jgi:hypothetical protein
MPAAPESSDRVKNRSFRSRINGIEKSSSSAGEPIAVVGWTAEQLSEIASLYDHMWTAEQARAFLLEHQSELESVMMAAACAFLDRELSRNVKQ